MTVTRTESSRSASRVAARISRRRVALSALRFSGRFRVIRRTIGAGSSSRMSEESMRRNVGQVPAGTPPRFAVRAGRSAAPEPGLAQWVLVGDLDAIDVGEPRTLL